MPMELLQCPCCDHFTLEGRGMYDICPVCFWEDDGTDLDRLDENSGCNHRLTLRQGRENFRRLGACESEMVQHVCASGERLRYKHFPRA
jgi:hypothetical protein